MDAAAAARMSDPDRNRQFSRCWDEEPATAEQAPRLKDRLGTLGQALLGALRRKRAEADRAVASAKTGGPPR